MNSVSNSLDNISNSVPDAFSTNKNKRCCIFRLFSCCRRKKQHVPLAPVSSDTSRHFTLEICQPSVHHQTLVEDNIFEDLSYFRTGKGSLYKVFEDGTTQRIKIVQDHGDGGIRGRSVWTRYLDLDLAQLKFFSKEQKELLKKVAGLFDGIVETGYRLLPPSCDTMQVLSDGRQSFELVLQAPSSDETVTFSIQGYSHPEIGLLPLEILNATDGGLSLHLGHRITAGATEAEFCKLREALVPDHINLHHFGECESSRD